MRWLRRIYDWTLSWADSRSGTHALFWIAFVESSCFIVPPDLLLIPLCLGKRERSLFYAGVCLAGSVLGGIAGYLLGFWVWEGVQEFFFAYIFSPETFDKVSALYQEWDFWVVFTAGFTPIPYKVITITAGVAHVDFAMFLIASVVGRGARFFLVAGLIRRYGEPMRIFIDRYFNLITIAMTILLVLGFLAIGLFLPDA